MFSELQYHTRTNQLSQYCCHVLHSSNRHTPPSAYFGTIQIQPYLTLKKYCSTEKKNRRGVRCETRLKVLLINRHISRLHGCYSVSSCHWVWPEPLHCFYGTTTVNGFVKRRNTPPLRAATDEFISLNELILLHFCSGDIHVRLWIEVNLHLTAGLSLGPPSINHFIHGTILSD